MIIEGVKKVVVKGNRVNGKAFRDEFEDVQQVEFSRLGVDILEDENQETYYFFGRARSIKVYTEDNRKIKLKISAIDN